MAGKSANSLGAKNWSPNSPSTRYNVSGKNREFYTFENAPGLGNYATGGTIIDGGDGYIYHIFTGNGTFQVNRPPAAIDSVDYLIVAGGGGGGGPGTGRGGGGGGGFRFGNIAVSNGPGSYPIVIGGGGPTSGPTAPTRSGNPSSAFGITAAGGGGGGQVPAQGGAPGGSGGGGGGGAPGVFPTGAGNSPPVIPRQGYNGGIGAGPTTPVAASGGGGGAGSVGSPASGSGGVGGAGGIGRTNPEFPIPIISKGIPAPILPSWSPSVTSLGFAFGGPGEPAPGGVRNSPANSGGGSSPGFYSSAGGSGIVCVRYKKTAAYSRATGGTIEPNTHPEHPGVWRHIFTSPGTFTVTDPTLQWIDYLAVGGGGGGAPSPGFYYNTPAPFGQGGAATGGGGGAGGFVTSIETSTTTPTTIPQAYPWNPGSSVQVGKQMPVGAASYPVDIGTGGNASTSGSNTTIGAPGASQIIAYGGGGGASAALTASNGGSGGGAGHIYAMGGGTAGTASPTPLIQGNPGGPAPSFPTNYTSGSGGGGAGAAGAGGPATPGNGGVGMYSVLSPSAYGTPGPVAGYRYFAGGGGGGAGTQPSPTGAVPSSSPLPAGSGGSGGGGAGGSNSPTNPAPPTSNGTNGTTNTGGGGGGGGGFYPPGGGPGPGGGGTGGSGGPGIVIIQYPE